MLYRRLGILTHIAHIVYGFLLAHASIHSPLLALLMFTSFTVYEFGEWLHDLITTGNPRRADIPDDEYAELGAGMAVYVILRLLHVIR